MFANNAEKPLTLIQNSSKVLDRLEKISRENQTKFLAPIFMRENGDITTKKELIKDRLRDALETSTSPKKGFNASGRQRPSSARNPSRGSFYQKLQKRSSSLEVLNRTDSRNTKTESIKTAVVANQESSLRSFLPKKSSVTASDGAFTVNDIYDLLEFTGNSELYRLVGTPGGKDLLESPCRAILEWIEFDRISMTNCLGNF